MPQSCDTPLKHAPRYRLLHVVWSLALLSACGESPEVDLGPSISTGPPAPLSVLSANVVCTDCPDASAIRAAWIQTLVERRNPDVVMMQGLQTREDMEAVATVLGGYEGFYIGKSDTDPIEYFGAVTWLRREGFALGTRTSYFLTPDRTPDTRFADAQELRAVVGASFRDCRSDIQYYWQSTLLEGAPAVQQASLDLIGNWSWYSIGASMALAGGFGIAPTDPLYTELLSPSSATEQPANTMDLAESRDIAAVPNVDLQALTDHVLVSTAQTQWRVTQWTLEATDYSGQRVSDHPPLWIVLQERDVHPLQRFVLQSESCRRGG
jgi:hypothetical protein